MVRKGVLTPPPARMWPGATLAAVLVVLAYANALHGPFVYDDHDTVTANPSLRDLTNLRFIAGYSLFRPFVNFSYAVDRAVWGFAPLGYHLTNVLLHAVTVVLWYWLVWRLVQDRNGAHRGPALAPARVAAAAAALWGVHPLLTEAVAYVSGRSEVLSALFALGSFLAFRHAALNGVRAAYGAGALAFLLALGSKETAAMLPFALIAWDRLLVGLPGFRWRFIRLHLPLLALVVAAGTVRLATLFRAEAALQRGPWENLLMQGRVVLRYLALVFVPEGQSIMHTVRSPSSALDLPSLAALMALVLLGVLAWRLRTREPLVTFGVLWFLLMLVPSSSVIALKEPMAEHRAYLAAAGLVLAAVAAAVRWLPRTRALAFRWAAVGLVVLLLMATRARNEVWADPVRLWSEAVETAPTLWESHYSLADVLRERARCTEAVPEYEAALRIAPAHRDAANNLGICLAQIGRTEEARAAFEAALEIDPRFARAYTNLGNLALVMGDAAEARRQFQRAAEHDRRNVVARRQIVALSEAQGQYADAVRYCHELMGIEGRTPELLECISRNEDRLRHPR